MKVQHHAVSREYGGHFYFVHFYIEIFLGACCLLFASNPLLATECCEGTAQSSRHHQIQISSSVSESVPRCRYVNKDSLRADLLDFCTGLREVTTNDKAAPRRSRFALPPSDRNSDPSSATLQLFNKVSLCNATQSFPNSLSILFSPVQHPFQASDACPRRPRRRQSSRFPLISLSSRHIT